MMTDDPFTGGVSRRKFLSASGAAGVLALAGCTENPDGGNGNGSDGEDGELSGTIDIAGSSTVFPLAEAVAAKFKKQHPEVEINISSTGSGGGFSNHFCKGKTDFNNASRPIQPEEKELCEQNGVEWHEIKVATDAVTVVVNNEADWVDCVTVDELKQIWKPDGAQKWSDVRSEWPDEKFDLYGAASTSGTFDYFTEVVVGEEGSHRQDYSATEEDSQIVAGVQGSKYTMGYFGFAYYFQNPDQVKALAVDNGDGECVKPSLETAKNGSYKPLSRPLFTYPAKSALEQRQVAEFARFFVEQSGNEELVANQVGYVPNTQETVNAELEELNGVIESVQG